MVWASLADVAASHPPRGGRLRERDLVAVTLPPGPAWLDLVHEVWAAGAALLPVDPRLPRPEAEALLALARPTLELSAQEGRPEWRRLESGEPAHTGVVLVVHTSGTAGVPKLVQFERAAIDA